MSIGNSKNLTGLKEGIKRHGLLGTHSQLSVDSISSHNVFKPSKVVKRENVSKCEAL